MQREEEMNVLVSRREAAELVFGLFLSKWGFDVQPVFTGTEALAQIEKLGFDVVLLDYRLPDLDGLSLARMVRERQPDAVIFLLTAFQLNELPMNAGLIDNYFNKPLDLQQLHQALEEVPRLRANRPRKKALNRR